MSSLDQDEFFIDEVDLTYHTPYGNITFLSTEELDQYFAAPWWKHLFGLTDYHKRVGRNG